MRRFLFLPALLLATPALAQEAPAQPSQASLIGTLNTELHQELNDLTLSQAKLEDAQQQIAQLTAQLQAATKKAK